MNKIVSDINDLEQSKIEFDKEYRNLKNRLLEDLYNEITPYKKGQIVKLRKKEVFEGKEYDQCKIVNGHIYYDLSGMCVFGESRDYVQFAFDTKNDDKVRKAFDSLKFNK